MTYSDEDYFNIVGDLLAKKEVQALAKYTHHKHTDRLKHSVRVSYYSFKVAKKLGLASKDVAIAGLLHDLFYYDTKTDKQENHLKEHPQIALVNALKIADLTIKEQDIILSHMFLISMKHIPKSRESLLVSLVDKAVSMQEVFMFSKIFRKSDDNILPLCNAVPRLWLAFRV